MEVKKAEEPSRKREILSESFEKTLRAIDRVEESPQVSEEDRAMLEAYRMVVQEKHDELNGRNGYDRVTDRELNAFSEYVRQDMEQAHRTITIGIGTAVLILLLVAILA